MISPSSNLLVMLVISSVNFHQKTWLRKQKSCTMTGKWQIFIYCLRCFHPTNPLPLRQRDILSPLNHGAFRLEHFGLLHNLLPQPMQPPTFESIPCPEAVLCWSNEHCLKLDAYKLAKLSHRIDKVKVMFRWATKHSPLDLHAERIGMGWQAGSLHWHCWSNRVSAFFQLDSEQHAKSPNGSLPRENEETPVGKNSKPKTCSVPQEGYFMDCHGDARRSDIGHLYSRPWLFRNWQWRFMTQAEDAWTVGTDRHGGSCWDHL